MSTSSDIGAMRRRGVAGGDGIVDELVVRHRVALERTAALLEDRRPGDGGADAGGERRQEGIA